MYTNYIVFSLL